MNICSQHIGLLGTKTVSFTETKTVINPVPHCVLGNKHIQNVQQPELLNGESVGAEMLIVLHNKKQINKIAILC